MYINFRKGFGTEILEEKEKKYNEKKIIRHTIIVYLTIATATFLIISILFTKILINVYIPSDSMENTLMTGDMAIGNRLAYKFGSSPSRFDIAIFYAPDDPSTLYIKRVIGLPGEKVTIKEGKVYIDDSEEPLDDSFICEEMDSGEKLEYEVPDGCYFMLGDNRNVSYDSRYWDNSYVPADYIVAKACFKYWKGFCLLQ